MFMRLLLWILCLAIVAASVPGPVRAEGVLHPSASAPLPNKYGSGCLPGRDSADPKCCTDRLSLCHASCKDDYAANGDMLYLRHCERACGEEFRMCQEER
jgi:hypothetical protein